MTNILNPAISPTSQDEEDVNPAHFETRVRGTVTNILNPAISPTSQDGNAHLRDTAFLNSVISPKMRVARFTSTL